jgi:hypothetical protein
VFATLSTGSFILGGVGVAVGLYLVLTAEAPSVGNPAASGGWFASPDGFGRTF